MVEAEVNLTEDIEKVRTAVLNIFPDLTISIENRQGNVFLVGEREGLEVLEELRRLLIRQRISDSARRVFRSCIVDDQIVVYLNKQAATTKHISFCESKSESPLGPITVIFESDRIDDVIEWLAPRIFPRQSERGTSTTNRSSANMIMGKMLLARSRKLCSSR